MAEAILDIKHWGNNLGVRLPAAVEGECVVIPPIPDTALTLEQRLARFDPDRHGGEAMALEPASAER